MGLQAMETFGAYKIIRSGPANWIDYVEEYIIKNADSVRPGDIVCADGETEGEARVAIGGANLDGSIAGIVLGITPPNNPDYGIDVAIVGDANGTLKVQVLRQTGGLFEVNARRNDESNAVEKNQPLVLGARGQLKTGAEATDNVFDTVTRASRATADVAATDPVQPVYW